MQEQSNKNLLVCLTPLQMLIASKIVDKNPISYDLLCLSYNENEKYDYYYKRLSHKSDLSWKFLIRSNNKLGRIYDLINFKLFLKKELSEKYENIYLASIDNPFCHLLLSIVKKRKLMTFDDGSVNINEDSIYYKYAKKSLIQEGILRLLGNTYSILKVITESNVHFTIYEDSKNVVKNTTFISLFSELKTNLNKKKIKIFLGQPLNEIKGINIDEIFKFLLSENVEYYFPHPRERVSYKEFSYINSSLIFEDYILELLKEDYYIEIYTILSTAALNVASLENVTVNVLYEEDLGLHYEKFYHLFNALNCNILIVH
ncbi:glycosyltransferase family 52 [Acinetobacter calcoaceticus]|uniref:glycosyltransferase family 52 n=1 Tax=Acinetobacter calcoaceticus TaxID=471 RepID=UPI001E2DC0D0|nr:glycosyltransferase family 52 [Acinetobacter calcoaceticus]UGQ29803.1 glycosyltransferase family 52 protein [Acinetobacter calcoaceticus]